MSFVSPLLHASTEVSRSLVDADRMGEERRRRIYETGLETTFLTIRLTVERVGLRDPPPLAGGRH